MAQLRNTREIQETEDKALEPFLIGLLISVVLAGLVIGFAAISMAVHSSDFDNARMNRAKLNQTLSSQHSPAELKAKAATLLELRHEGYVDTLDKSYYGSLTTKDVVSAVEMVAKTGQPLHLENHHYSWHYFRYILWVTLLSALALWGFIGFISYADECALEDRPYDRRYLMDLPWKDVWPAFFVLLTPVGWPFYAFSAFRVKGAFKEAGGQRPQPPARRDGFRRVYRDYDIPGERPRVRAFTKFTPAPKAARQEYISLRERTWREQADRRKRELEDEKGDLTVRLRDFGEAIRSAQTRRNLVDSELKKLEGIDAKTAEIPDRKHLDAEFDRLMALPGVAGVRVINDRISVLLKARIEWTGTQYDLGDWDLRFGAGTGLRTYELRSGIRDDWCGNYPAYRLGDGQFCFGDRQFTIDDNLRKGQFLEGIELAVDCIQSVNRKHAHDIPRAFNVAKGEVKTA